MKTNIIKKCFLAAAMLMPMMASAQNGYEIYKKSGTRVVYAGEEIDSIVYKNDIQSGLSISDLTATKGSINFNLNLAEGKSAKYKIVPDWLFPLYTIYAERNFGFNLNKEYGYRDIVQFQPTIGATSNIVYENCPEGVYNQNLLGGYRYIIVASLYSEETNSFEGDPIIKDIRLPEPGKSANELTLEVVDLTETIAKMNIVFPANTKWVAAKLFKKVDYDSMLANEGEYHIKKAILAQDALYYDPCYGVDLVIKPGTDYVYAAVGTDSNDDEMFNTISFTSPEKIEHLIDINATKQALSYSITENEVQMYRHMYISEPQYLSLRQYAEDQAGSPEYFNENSFRQTLLRQYGMQGVGCSAYQWTNISPLCGENWLLAIVPGLKYYVLYCRFNEWDPEYGSIVDCKEVQIPEAGESPERFAFNVTFPGSGVAKINIGKPDKVPFYFCGYIGTDAYDSFFGQLTTTQIGEVMLMQGSLILQPTLEFELSNMQGQAISYIIYGIDVNGDVYLQREDFVVPEM